MITIRAAKDIFAGAVMIGLIMLAYPSRWSVDSDQGTCSSRLEMIFKRQKSRSREACFVRNLLWCCIGCRRSKMRF
jgi:hypothetical protein